ncbi:MAG TPA: lysophospholipid acyltransferase family protein [Methylomirabilota bacterium]|nr:lysophospholipid acyltransferase family protein [Methylomirabilota bacterium]
MNPGTTTSTEQHATATAAAPQSDSGSAVSAVPQNRKDAGRALTRTTPWHYRADFWRAYLALARRLPEPVLVRLAQGVALAYWACAARRRRTVRQNLAGVPDIGPRRAGRQARRLFLEFARKLTDLWRYEAGADVGSRFIEFHGVGRLDAAHARGRGVLLLTVHLGNWELGAPLLTARGLPLQIVTRAEPDATLSAMRQAARNRWGVETLTLGDNPFAAVEVIRRLEAGKIIALLVDRPGASSAVEVRLFGRKFHASVAAAELARASGCALVPVIVTREQGGYRAEALPEIEYDRATLGSRAGRVDLTQRVITAFEPSIRRHATQWFHFVPIWPES